MRIECCPAELAASMNASLLEQAVVNLIQNAIAYSPPGQSVEVWGLAGEREFEIRVRDHGCGISREHRRGSSNASTASTSRGAATPAAQGWPGHRQAHRPAPRRPNSRPERPGRRQHVLHFLAEVTLRIVNQPVLHSRLSLRERTPVSRSERRQLLTRRSYRISMGLLCPSFSLGQIFYRFGFLAHLPVSNASIVIGLGIRRVQADGVGAVPAMVLSYWPLLPKALPRLR